MQIFDHTFPTPTENLAADEALLEFAESGEGGEILRFWESKTPFVALGYTNQIETETQRAQCEKLNIPILRRVSGGGTVLQGPGSFNYALVLEIGAHPLLATVSESNAYIMARQKNALQTQVATLNAPATELAAGPCCARNHRPSPTKFSASAKADASRTAGRAASSLAGNEGSNLRLQVLAGDFLGEIQVQGTTDLTRDDRKFSGNAQRRKRRFTLFHGTFLLDLPRELIAQTLKLPARQPDYRAHRTHEDFLTTIPLSRAQIKSALVEEWNARDAFDEFPDELLQKLLDERYFQRDWNEKF